MKKIVIVGGVAGGANVAARARRLSESAEIVIFERGGYVSFANCGLPYHIGGEIERREKLLVHTPQSLQERFNISVKVKHEVQSIDRTNKTVSVCDLVSGQIFSEGYDELVLATGARPLMPPIPGLDQEGIFTLRDIDDMDGIIEWIRSQKAQSAAVVGAGFIGLEMVEQLHRLGLEVSLIEAAPQVLGVIDRDLAAFLHHEVRRKGVTLVLNDPIDSFGPNRETRTKSGRTIKSDIVIFGIGVVPESSLAENAGLELGVRNTVKVNERLQTNDPNIWALGDCIEVPHGAVPIKTNVPLAGPANRQGRMVADNIFGASKTLVGTLGTAIARVFDLAAGATGANERLLTSLQIPYRSITIHPSSHASYYPGSEPLTLKILFHEESGKLLGAAAIGKDGIDKRMDVLATALRAEMTVFDLIELELAYAPPFGSAKDPVNLAAMAAENMLKGQVESLSPLQGIEAMKEGKQFLDVRNDSELSNGNIPGAIHIPLSNLRSRLYELSKDQELIVYCHSGQRSYMACRILMQNGFQCKNLSGAWKSHDALVRDGVTENS